MPPQPPPGKVAIPALRTNFAAESNISFKKGRNPHACEYCRKAKAGCTGGLPCARCRSANLPCEYGDGKRDKERKSEQHHSNSGPANRIQDDVEIEFGDRCQVSTDRPNLSNASAYSTRQFSVVRRVERADRRLASDGKCPPSTS